MSSTQSHVAARTESGVVILTIKEKQLTGEDLCAAIREEMLSAVQEKAKVIVDFSQVEYVSSVAFRALLSLRRRIHQLEGRLVLCNLSPLVSEVFKATRLLINSRSSPSMFEEQPTVEAGIAALNGPASL
jgi:anti-sigma B factor antagonist